MNEKLKTALQNSKAWVLATAGEAPNAAMIFFHELDADDNLVFYQVFMSRTVENVKAGSKAAVFINPDGTMEGYQIKGSATYSDAPELIEKGNAMAVAMGLSVKGAVIVKPEEVINATPGPDIGKRL